MSLNNWRISRKNSNLKSSSENSISGKEIADDSKSNSKSNSDSISLDGRIWSHSSFPPTLKNPNSNSDLHRGLIPLSYPSPDIKLSVSSLGLPKEASLNQINTVRASLQGKAAELEAISEGVLKCTLCMEIRTPEKGNSAVTECGHVFCWDCIVGWAEEKVSFCLKRFFFGVSFVLEDTITDKISFLSVDFLHGFSYSPNVLFVDSR